MKKIYYTINSQEMQHDLDPNDHDLQDTPMVNYSGAVNVPANGVKR